METKVDKIIMTLKLKEFIDNLPAVAEDQDLIRCSSCNNALIHCGAFKIETYKDMEGLLCQDCLRTGRLIENAIIIHDDNKVSYVPIIYPKTENRTPKPEPTSFSKVVKSTKEQNKEAILEEYKPAEQPKETSK